MLRRRIVACLDVAGGRVVKGVQFAELRDCGDPVEAAARYAQAGIDELVWLNIAAGQEEWRALLAAVERAAGEVDVPLTVGGGVRDVTHVRELLLAGADKVSVNSAALDQPALLAEAAERFGVQCVVCALDARRENGTWRVYADGGRRPTGRAALAWADEAAARGAGELLVTSIDADGGGRGYDLALVQAVAERVPVPVVASGGAGGPDDLAEALAAGAEAALAASIFHDGTHTVEEVKAACRERGLPVR
jgi:cyclase